MTKAITPPDESQSAEQLDQLITVRQAGMETAVPVEATPADVALVDALVQMAATTTPPPDFVADLAAELERHYPLRPTASANAPRSSWISVIGERLLLWDQPRRRLAYVAVTILLLLAGFLLTPPTARARLWDWLAGFGLISEAQVIGRSIPLVVPVTPTDAPLPMTLAEIQQQAPFPIHPPTWLPAGLHFTGGFVDATATGTQVTLAYHTSVAPAGGYPADAPLLLLVISDGALSNRPLLAEGYQQAVRIGSTNALYSHGNWRSQTPVRADDAATGALVWDSTIDDAWLTWQTAGRTYLLYAQGLGFGVAEMARVAESMKE